MYINSTDLQAVKQTVPKLDRATENHKKDTHLHFFEHVLDKKNCVTCSIPLVSCYCHVLFEVLVSGTHQLASFFSTYKIIHAYKDHLEMWYEWAIFENFFYLSLFTGARGFWKRFCFILESGYKGTCNSSGNSYFKCYFLKFWGLKITWRHIKNVKGRQRLWRWWKFHLQSIILSYNRIQNS